ncbi:MAG: ABC transporter ATP-binding protein [Chitinispirillaceae bacterium]|nr:ABC transporter ATP-binding protein [Chitinispirillaceae bacterium]
MIHLDNVILNAGTFSLSVTLQVANNEYVVVLGRSGCGKTMLLESICGLRRIESGTLHIDGHDCTAADPRFRKVGYVPQESSLFGNMSVEKNIGFGLAVAQKSHREIAATVHKLSEMLSIGNLLERRTTNLSGGERQRIALARALAVSPSVMLFDEPVSAVDESARNSICKELAALQQQLSIPFVHVCHSVEETSLVATRVAIMRDGRIFRQGALEDLLEHPKDVYTAGLLKTDNVLSVKGDGNDGCFICNGTVLQGPIARNVASVMIHPWNIRFASAEHAVNTVEATVMHIRRRGPQVELGLGAGVPLRMFSTPEEVSSKSISPGSAVTVSLPPEFLQALEG